jgi:hypothetical protein
MDKRHSKRVSVSLWHITHVKISALTGLAGVAEGQGQLVRAAQLLGTVEMFLEITSWASNVSKREYERIRASVRRALGEEAFDTAAAKGRDMTLDEAIAFALEGS